MANDLKYYFDHDDQGKNRLYYGSRLLSEHDGHNRTFAYSSMVRHRPFPARVSPTPAIYSYRSFDYQPGYGFSSGHPDSVHRSGQWGHAYPWNTYVSRETWDSTGDIPSADLMAKAKLTESISSFGESLFSLRETGAMVWKRSRQISQMARDLSRGNWRGLESQIHNVPGSVKHLPASRRLADGWLELQFGWVPLVSDVYAAVDLYRRKSVAGQSVSTYARTGTPVKMPKGSTPDFGFNHAGNFRNYQGVASVKYYGTVSNPSLYTLNQLGLANPLKLAWDLLPFSFVVDWFMPIGKILAYLSGGLGLSQMMVCTVSERGSCNTWSEDGGSSVSLTVVRGVSTPKLIPDLTKLSPRSLGIWHAITGASLVRQSFHR